MTNKQELEEALAYLQPKTILGLDTETTGLDPLTDKVLLISVGDETAQFVIDVAQLGSDITPFMEFITSKNIVKVLHNAKFDYKMLKANFGTDLQNIKDTYLADCLLTQGQPNISHSLDACLERYRNVSLSKNEQKSFIGMAYGESFTAEQLDYSANDIKHILPLFTALHKEIKARGMETLAELEYETSRATGDLELNGIYLDKSKWLALKDGADTNRKAKKTILDSHFKAYCEIDEDGFPIINYRSPKQLLPILRKITRTSIPSTSVQILKKFSHPVIDALLSYRAAEKKFSTYGEEFYNKNVHPVDQRVHGDFWQLGRAHTGRYASSNPNMQNIPREAAYRAAFTAQSKDYKIIAADFSGQELRLLAHISQEPKFLKALEEGVDLHTNSASLVFGVPYEEVSKAQRNSAKSITFGLVYGIGPKKLSENLKISYNDAIYLMNKYFKTFPEIKKALDRLEAQARDTKMAISPLDGRQSDLSFKDWTSRGSVAHALNIAKNLPFQGTGASTTKLALCRIKHRFDKKGYGSDAKLINVVHDEILVECKNEIVADVVNIVETEMVKAFNIYAPSVPMEAAAEVGNHWIH
ncbi:MAG: hypothetical protein H8E12_16990 [Rhodobacteraceae bacterium]|nr:hypothetical protein [Paracoccaceae bacterium]